MFNIKQTTGSVIAADTQSSVCALNAAVLSQARLCASVIETAEESDLPVGATQELLDSIAATMQGLVSSRSDLVSAVRQINLIQAKSNLKETSFGCPAGLPPIGKYEQNVERPNLQPA